MERKRRSIQGGINAAVVKEKSLGNALLCRVTIEYYRNNVSVEIENPNFLNAKKISTLFGPVFKEWKRHCQQERLKIRQREQQEQQKLKELTDG